MLLMVLIDNVFDGVDYVVLVFLFLVCLMLLMLL